jgi:hypothetical protein
VLICYDFHFGIFNKEEDLMFATKPRLFSIGTIVVPTLVCSNQPVKLITLVGFNLVEQVIVHVELVSKSLVLSNIHVKLLFTLLVHITIPLDTFQQHLLEMFFQHEIGKMEIDKRPSQTKVQNLCIAGWTITEEEQLMKISLGSKKNLQQVKIIVDLEPIVSFQLIELLKELKDIFT